MSNHIPGSAQILTTNSSGNAVVSSRQINRFLAPLVRAADLIELALDERHKTARYSIERLAAELQRQRQIIAERGGVTPEEKLRLQSLTLDCMNKLQDINVQLDARLVEILLQ